MRKIIIISSGLLLIGLISYLIYSFKDNSVRSEDTALIDFAILDTSAVTRIEIYDSHTDQLFVVKRKNNAVWTDDNGNCVQQHLPNIMLETFQKVTLKGYVGKSAQKTMYNLLMAKHKAVKIFIDGQWAKTWYVGHSTQDHNGTHMLLETPNKKSDLPVIMSMKSFYGILGPRFQADPKRYQCSFMFSYKQDEIEGIQVINRIEPSESFEINRKSLNYEVKSNDSLLTNINQDNLIFYLNGFQNIHFNQPNYTLSESEIKGLKNSKADYELTVKGETGEYHANFYRRPNPDFSKDSIEYDPDYLWGVLPNGEVVRMQYYVLGPILDGQLIFVEK